jgi:hypothetical protein
MTARPARTVKEEVLKSTGGAARTCRVCGEEGHLAAACPNGARCHSCQQPGHRASACTNPRVEVCRRCQGLNDTVNMVGHEASDCTFHERPDTDYKCRRCDQWGHRTTACPQDPTEITPDGCIMVVLERRRQPGRDGPRDERPFVDLLVLCANFRIAQTIEGLSGSI